MNLRLTRRHATHMSQKSFVTEVITIHIDFIRVITQANRTYVMTNDNGIFSISQRYFFF
jgi:hypothetical protein